MIALARGNDEARIQRVPGNNGPYRRLFRENQTNAGAIFGRLAVGRVVHLKNDVRTGLYQSRCSRRKDHSGFVRRDAAQLPAALLSFAGGISTAAASSGLLRKRDDVMHHASI